MEFDREIEIFIRDYVKDLNEGTAAIFAGAGLSIPAGFVNWQELMSEIAYDLGLDVEQESDLVSLAQFHVNENRTRSKVSRKILEEFVEETEETENHRILARLPISSIWTTNYDELIEKAFLAEGKVSDVKHNVKQLLNNRPKRDVVIFKMHGDVSCPHDAIITKEQYEQYHQTHEPFINALTGELTTKTFLFLGFSFTDPNLDYVLSRLNFRFSGNKKQHYCISKRPKLGDADNPDQATYDYSCRKQVLIINDLKRYGIKTLLINEYGEIAEILCEIESRFKKRTIFISGSAEVYAPIERLNAVEFIHKLSRALIENNYRIVNGFGWGVGSSVINGALEAIYDKPLRYSDSQLILRPFPQFKSGNKELSDLWDEYRHKMISLSGISIFLFGNKEADGEVVTAGGVIREFEISHSFGNLCIPVASTHYAAKEIFERIIPSVDKYFPGHSRARSYLEKLSDENTSLDSKIQDLVEFIGELTK
ncbi:SIR2 family protein [uncultured Microbulbifer sp.]|uniref:SIR2 family protein n=1 Tax=uncultured Microbulbifer sp. TaxID=348147 RepID=UPI0026025E97|nr:SIR2 family protein [uncultured Microbulbifer sp.]